MTDHPAVADDRCRRHEIRAGITSKENPMNTIAASAHHKSYDAATRRSRRGRRAALVALPAGLALLATGCFYEEGSGDLVRVSYDAIDDADISGLSVLDDLDVQVVVDPSRNQSAHVVIDDNLADNGYAYLDDDGLLSIGFDWLSGADPSQTPQVTLVVNSLDTIENHGDGDLVVSGVDSESIDVVNSGDGTLTASGAAERVDLESTGGGSVDLARMKAGTVELSDTDQGDIEVYATEAIEGEISGDADVVVHGDPASTDVDLDGDGELVTA
jgi:Putative auto-transporter adhesin, head GIN domain